MNWNISAWSIRRPVPSIVLFLILTILGVGGFLMLGIDETPNIDDPIVNVSVSEVGAAPSELETQVTRKIEDSVSGLGHIKHITSNVTEGSSSTTIEFELGTDTDRAVNDVRDAVTRIRTQLPAGINGDPIVQRVDFVGGAFATYSVSSSSTVNELSWLIDNDISRSLQGVKGVGQVQRSGGVDREIHVDLDPTRLESLGLTADGVNTQIRQLNINMPGGRMDLAGGEQSVRTLGSTPTVAALRAMRIALPDGGWARLDTLGSVMDTEAEPRQKALLDGRPVVAFSIVRSTGSNMVDVEKAVDAKLAELRPLLPKDVDITLIRTNAIFVMESYHASLDALIIGAVLAVIVIWIFLWDFRAALISALAMPLSVIPTFAIMQWANFTLNNMSLLGLSLVIGILVDDAIVEIENIVRHINMGKKPYQAALEAADEIGLAVVATTFSIIVVFLPVAFMGGIPGQFFRQFGLTVAVAVWFSLMVARLVTPMMAAHWMRAPKHEEKRGGLMRAYDGLLVWSLKHRLVTVLGGVGFFVVSIYLFAQMPTDLFSREDRGQTALHIELPPSASLEATTDVVSRIGAMMQKQPEVKTVFSVVGTPVSNGFGSVGSQGTVNTATIYVTLKPRGERKASQQEIEARMRPQVQALPGTRVTFGQAEGGPSGQLQILLASDEPVALGTSAEALLRDMRKMPNLSDVTSSASLRRPEILVVPDTTLAAEQNVSIQSIARTASIATLGDIDQNLPKFDLPNRQINIRVEIDPSHRQDLDMIRGLKVMSGSGHLVPLSTLARIEVGSGPSELDRFDRQRQVTISASMNAGATLGESVIEVHKLASFKALPSSVHELPTGDVEIQRDVFGGFARAMGAAVLFIYAVLVLLFGEFLQPLTIMVSLPLSLGGALMALLLQHQPIGFYALIGIIMLMGLVTKNAILLVEYCLKAMHQGQPRTEAIMAAGEARMRPILMTTIAMIAGMIPIAVGIGAGSEERSPMAMAVIGGLITSTFLTLVLVPVVFTLMDDVKRFLGRFRPHHEHESHSAPPPLEVAG